MSQELFNICSKVRARQIDRYKTVDGACKETSIAIAFEAARANITVCICAGTYDGEAHYWIRHENTIYDATASQFGVTDSVLVINESDALNFNEDSFVIVNGALVNQLLST
ncbi:hypothetical protein [Pseudomonas sp. URMO17WK12:I2]|uniref:hypothetical protein n=1 Tax=Pseudomonas sp. URMO17WK12:I2 TaxID=1261623 RepID=UPI0011B5088D|nr:hypothetical protein [Pseudomonas sp. URMO17WK12:I2]